MRYGTRQLFGKRTRHGTWHPTTDLILRRRVADFVSAIDKRCGKQHKDLPRATCNQKSSNVFDRLNFEPFKISDLSWIRVSSKLRTPQLKPPILDWWGQHNFAPTLYTDTDLLNWWGSAQSNALNFEAVGYLIGICSEDFTQANFGLSEYVHVTGRKLPQMLMTRDGFTFLVINVTG